MVEEDHGVLVTEELPEGGGVVEEDHGVLVTEELVVLRALFVQYRPVQAVSRQGHINLPKGSKIVEIYSRKEVIKKYTLSENFRYHNLLYHNVIYFLLSIKFLDYSKTP